RERGDQQPCERVHRVPRRNHPPATTAASAVERSAHRIQRRQQTNGQAGSANLRHLRSLHYVALAPGFVWNFDGHFVTSESRSPTNVPLRSFPVTITSRPTRNGSGTTPV